MKTEECPFCGENRIPMVIPPNQNEVIIRIAERDNVMEAFFHMVPVREVKGRRCPDCQCCMLRPEDGE